MIIRRPVFGAACGAMLALAGCVSTSPDMIEQVSRTALVAPLMPNPASMNAVDRALYDIQTAQHVSSVPELIGPDFNDQCWARQTVPAVIKPVARDVLLVQAQVASDGTVIRPALYTEAIVPRVIHPASETRFETLCPALLTPDLIASLQRALLARGYFDGIVNTMMDAATTASIHRYQQGRGLDSPLLSLETARELGLVAIEINLDGNPETTDPIADADLNPNQS